ncbi:MULTISPECIES: hypothetical protein, partial [Enterobacteriaceae]|uniref:hypothetical protein n=1 Tax=Enterobacteriaceae TaxID=543 RepID=UPI0019D6FCBE
GLKVQENTSKVTFLKNFNSFLVSTNARMHKIDLNVSFSYSESILHALSVFGGSEPSKNVEI